MSDSDLNFFSTNEPNTSSNNTSAQDSSSKDSSRNMTSSEASFYTEEITQPTNDFGSLYFLFLLCEAHTNPYSLIPSPYSSHEKSSRIKIRLLKY